MVLHGAGRWGRMGISDLEIIYFNAMVTGASYLPVVVVIVESSGGCCRRCALERWCPNQ